MLCNSDEELTILNFPERQEQLARPREQRGGANGFLAQALQVVLTYRRSGVSSRPGRVPLHPPAIPDSLRKRTFHADRA